LRKTFIIIFKISVTVIVVFFLTERIYDQYDKLSEALTTFFKYPWILLIVLLLMPFNWLIEALKWKMSISGIVNISIKLALIGVLSGISLGFVTPHAVGDYFARIWTLDHTDRKKTIGPIMLNRVAQLLPTLVFGSLSLYVVFDQLEISTYNYLGSFPLLLVFISCALFIVSAMLFLKYGKHFKELKSYLNVLRNIAIIDYAKIIGLSFLRYAIFSVQFIILLSLFDIDISLVNQFLGVAFIFLCKSVLPTFNFFNDLGVREFSAIIYFDVFAIETAPIILASLVLWLVNIALPAILGLFFIRKFKIEIK
jgi:hypothetical protein